MEFGVKKDKQAAQTGRKTAAEPQKPPFKPISVVPHGGTHHLP